MPTTLKDNEFVPTHKGWFGVCPIYLGDIDADAPMLAPRLVILTPLMWFSIAMFSVCMKIYGLIDPFFEPFWPIVITGEL